jgi:hypothetical protein
MTEMMTTITPSAFVRIGQEAVLGADAMQLIFYRTKRPDYPLDWAPTLAKLRPLAFCRTRAGLEREISERGLVLTARPQHRRGARGGGQTQLKTAGRGQRWPIAALSEG